MSRIRDAIRQVERVAQGREWVLVWQSTHPDVPDERTRYAISYPQKLAKENAAQLLMIGLADLGYLGGDE